MAQNDGSSDTHTLYAWLSRDGDGVEGVITAGLPGLGTVPLVATSQELALDLQEIAALSAQERGFPAMLVRFERADTLTTVSV